MRLIDADKMEELLRELGCVTKYGDINTSVNELNNIIGVCKVDPVKHGWWTDTSARNMKLYTCSECGRYERARYPFCHACGAKMDGEKRHE